MLDLQAARRKLERFIPRYELLHAAEVVELKPKVSEEDWCFVFGAEVHFLQVERNGIIRDERNGIEFFVVEKDEGKIMVAGPNHLSFDMRNFKENRKDYPKMA